MTDTRIVPVEPTEEMIAAGRGWREWDQNDDAMARAYKAMCAAAPTSDLAALEKQAAIEWAKHTFEFETMWVDGDWDEDPDDSHGWSVWDGYQEAPYTRACTILEANKLLERHDKNEDWVRIIEKESEDG